MSNVEGSKPRYERVQEWMVSLHDGKCTARDVSDLLRVAQREAEKIDHKQAQMDDAFWVQTDGERLFVEIRTPVSSNEGEDVRSLRKVVE